MLYVDYLHFITFHNDSCWQLINKWLYKLENDNLKIEYVFLHAVFLTKLILPKISRLPDNCKNNIIYE